MKKILLTSLSLNLLLFNCSSEQVQKPKDNRDEITKELNKKLETIEIQGFAGVQTVLPESLYST